MKTPTISLKHSMFRLAAVLAVLVSSAAVPTVNGKGNPPVLTWALSGNTLQLSWPGEYVDWSLQGEINQNGNWGTIPGAQAPMQLAINPACSSEYFRLAGTGVNAGLYSSNVVGYANFRLAVGTSNLLANPFYNANQSIDVVIPNPPDGSWLELATNPFTLAIYDPSYGEWMNLDDATPSTLVLNQGVPFWFENGDDSTYTNLVFVGELTWQNMIPSITTQPLSQAAATNSTVTFASATAGITPLASQWLFNGAQLTGATNASLVLTNVTVLNQGNYVLIITNVYGSATSSVASLTVGSPPMLVRSPASQSQTIGNRVTFSSLAQGTAPLNYQWYFQSNALAGATNAGLAFGPVLTNAAGGYQVIVTNLYGGATSAVATLTVLVQPNSYGLSNAASGGSKTVLLAGAPGSTNRVWASTNLVQWQVVATNTAGPNGLSQFTDTNVAGKPSKYYRLSNP